MKKVKITELPLFSVEDFRCRWLLARMAALEGALKLEKREGGLSMELLVPYELELLNKIHSEETASINESHDILTNQSNDLIQDSNSKEDFVIRQVFDNSRRLGLSLVRFLGHSFDLEDLAEVIPKLGTPCFSGSWSSHNQAYVLERSGCSEFHKSNSNSKSLFCNYWREALDGLLMGIGTEERLARHRSLGAKDDSCQDILFDESSDKKSKNSIRWGEIPTELANQLKVQSTNFEKKGYQLFVHGYSEGKLFYEMKTKALGQCGPGEEMISRHFESCVSKDFPNIRFEEISPKTVLDHKES